MKKRLLILVGVAFLTGCSASYVTPGRSVDLEVIEDSSIKEIYERKPSIKFPANIAFTRIQESGYESYSTQGYGRGLYSVVTTREIESDDDLDQISSMPNVSGFAPLGRIIIPEDLSSIKQLRIAAAKLQADVLLVYTLETSFQVGSKRYGPLEAISLGFMKSKEVIVTSTASAAFYDARTEYLYGISEATDKKMKMSDLWDNMRVVDELRKEAEAAAFHALIPQLEKTWKGIVKRYSN